MKRFDKLITTPTPSDFDKALLSEGAKVHVYNTDLTTIQRLKLLLEKAWNFPDNPYKDIHKEREQWFIEYKRLDREIKDELD